MNLPLVPFPCNKPSATQPQQEVTHQLFFFFFNIKTKYKRFRGEVKLKINKIKERETIKTKDKKKKNTCQDLEFSRMLHPLRCTLIQSLHYVDPPVQICSEEYH